MLISHEVPIGLLKGSKIYNDYDYALVHLFFKYPEYKSFYEDSLAEGRVVYLDNSIYELGEAFNFNKFYEECEKLHNINAENFYAIVPDVFDNCDQTIENIKKFRKLNDKMKLIGVLQGKNYDELFRCYNEIKNDVDIIAINHLSKGFGFSKDDDITTKSKLRCEFINKFLNNVAIGTKVHLLGCFLPHEINLIDISRIYSMDTSSPIINGFLKIDIDNVVSKPELKIIDIMDKKLSWDQINYILNNIKKFKKIGGK